MTAFPLDRVPHGRFLGPPSTGAPATEPGAGGAGLRAALGMASSGLRTPCVTKVFPSRGAHARDDHPKRDDEAWLKPTLARLKPDGTVSLDHRPVRLQPLTNEVASIPPTERVYRARALPSPSGRVPRGRIARVDRVIDDVVEIAPRACDGVPGGREAVVVFLHGRGQGPRTAHRVADAFATALVVAPGGGVPLSRGTTWFENRSVGVACRDSVERAEDRFLDWLDRRFGAQCRPWLCGFSNGGAFAGHLLMRHPGRFEGAALLSAPLVLPPWTPGALGGRPVFYGRGDRDPMVPSRMFEAAEAYLDLSSGGIVTRRIYDIAHEVDPREVRDLGDWFRAAAAPLPGAAPL